MSEREFRAFLIRCVADGLLTEAEAGELLRKFRRGEIDEKALPLPLRDAIGFDDIAIFAIVIAALSLREREKRRDRLQDEFTEEAKRLAKSLFKEKVVSEWQGKVKEAVARHTIRQATYGAGRALTPAQLGALDEIMTGQTAYLSRFADEVSIRMLEGQPLSEAQIASRTALYSGVGRSAWFQHAEANAEDGTVYDYVSLDDEGTCAPCLDAERGGPYLPNEGPQPGEVCEGRGNCRCERIARFAPEEARALA